MGQQYLDFSKTRLEYLIDNWLSIKLLQGFYVK